MIKAPDSPLVADLYPSPNIGPRAKSVAPWILLMHYTGLPSCETSLDVLSRPDCKVSCHYVVDLDGRITQMVSEETRAWHAGVASWQGETDINSGSIGIEIQNVGHKHGYPPFPQVQMTAVRDLALDILSRHRIKPQHVLAHSDVAPGRKPDPGEKFDWESLHAAGIGHWVPPSAIDATDCGFQTGATDAAIAEAQAKFKAYGYAIDVTGKHDEQSADVVKAFQRHFRQGRVDGHLDASTIRTLHALLDALQTLTMA